MKKKRHVKIITLALVLATANMWALPLSTLPAQTPQRRAVLLNPANSVWNTKAPATVIADIETSRGTITIELIRDWAPVGVDHFFNLARAGFFDDTRFFRVVYGFVAQFGIAADPAVAKVWRQRPIKADPVRGSNVRGTITYAQFKPTDRTTNVFINLSDNLQLDTLRFAPIGRVIKGMDVADSLNAVYGDFPSAEEPIGHPAQLYARTNRYLDEKFPLLDRILKISVRPDSARKPQ